MDTQELSIKLRRNHKFLSASGLIKQICAPLKHLKINMFTYLKIFNDGSEVNLSTHPEWIIDYYKLNLYSTSNFSAQPTLYQKGFKWWPLESSLPIFKHGREYYDSYYGLTYCLPEADGCAFFFFSTSMQHQAQLEFYWNNLDLLEKFIDYFCGRASSLIKECETARLILPSNFRQLAVNQVTPAIASTDFNLRDQFLAELQIHQPDRLLPLLKNYQPLTKRERQCLDLLLKQLTAAQIAEQLNLSVRTIEDYLDRLKQKLQCRTKQELLIKFSEFLKQFFL